jgi:hypothetical protein
MQLLEFMQVGRATVDGVMFKKVTPGWVEVTPDASLVAQAKADREQRDREHGEGAWVASREKRWAGELGEICLEQYLKLVGEPYERFGGVDQYADFYVSGQSVSVKTQVRHRRMYRDGNVVVPVQHSEAVEDWFCFTCLVDKPDRVLLLGVIPTDTFRADAKLMRRGEQFPGTGAAVTNDCLLMNVQHLRDVLDWVGLS